MEVRVRLEGEDIGPKTRLAIGNLGDIVREAMRESAEGAVEKILARGRADIAGAGNFGGDWTEALQADITETQRTIRVEAGMFPKGPPVTFWKVFEYGASIFAHNDKGLLTWPNKSGFSIDGKVPLFISKPSVTIPKKFHLHEILKQVAKETVASFKALLKEKR
jgi:hypothetical protein